ncbi:MAG: acylphosphatase [Deltaproteobacteria bacterium]|nr:acylphosphatase [Deltaproteobacteria bacterium]
MGGSDLASVQATVHGHVQGVFFRAFVSQQAKDLELAGYVRNLPGGGAVEVVAEGESKQLEKLVSRLKVGPPAARVERVVANWAEYSGSYTAFSIRY